MSANKGSILVRLQEVKHWQGNFDNLYLQKKGIDTTLSNHSSDSETIENEKNTSATDVPKELDFDKIKITPPRKPFEQLLEEKLAEVDSSPVNCVHKPKKPFLKKGSGLSRFRLKYDPKRIKRSDKNSFNNNEEGDGNNGIITPLKIPEMRMKSKGIWCSINSEDHNINAVNSESGYSNIQFSDLNISTFFQNQTSPSKSPQSKSKFSDKHVSNCNKWSPSGRNTIEQACFDNSYQRELDIFEALEKRADNSSFCSTNSSIMQLLSASTPQKRDRLTPHQLDEPEAMVNDKEIKLQKKLEEVHHKTEFINNFMSRLKRLSDLTLKKGRVNESESDFLFSFDLSTSRDDSASTPSSQSTDFESMNNLTDKHDIIAPNSPNSVRKERPSRTRVYLSKELCLEEELDKLKSDKQKLINLWKESEKKVVELTKDYEQMKHVFETEIGDLKCELDNEKWKYAKEKQMFESYLNQIQNKPNKKEKEEILLLKRELTEVQELLKLKETKNGSTQARLRTQIKALEKEVAELRNEVQKLTKENSKLTAAQKLSNRRPASDLKMLKEINKNLNKLTEQKNIDCSDDSKENRSMWEKLKSMKHIPSEAAKKEQNLDVQVVYEADKTKFNNVKGINTAESIASRNCQPSDLEMTNFCNITLEKKYEEVFGEPGSHPKANLSNNNTLNDSKLDKIETLREDGTKEIKYNNGNVKTISPDEKLVVMKYFNGDVKETNLSTKTFKYYYASTKTWHIQNPDGSETVEFPNGQTEKKFKDGKCEIRYPDGVLQTIFPDGTEKAIYPDGSVLIVKGEHDRILHLPNGQKEIHTKKEKRREYPDGTVKILYPDGTQETRFANGRIRMKDPNGTLIMDTENPA